MGGIPEDELALSALGVLDADLGVDMHQDGWVVEAGAVGTGKVLEVERGHLVAAGGPGALHASSQAHVADLVALGGAPDVLAPLLQYYPCPLPWGALQP